MSKFLFVTVAILMVTSMSFGQQSGDMEFSATVAALNGPLIIDASTGPIWDVLKPGTSYKCIADAVVNVANITPFDNNQGESFEPGILAITGSAGADVVVTFILPTKLIPSAGVGFVDMTYDNQSASVVDVNGSGLPFIFFNPSTPFTVGLDAGGYAEIWVGGNPSVSANATDGDTFLGYALITAEYTGF